MIKSPCDRCWLESWDKNCNGCHYCTAKTDYVKAIRMGIEISPDPPAYEDLEWAKTIITSCSTRPPNYNDLSAEETCMIPYCNREGKKDVTVCGFNGKICQLHEKRLKHRESIGVPVVYLTDLNINTKKALKIQRDSNRCKI